MEMNYMLKMVLACAIPLLAIFLLPVLGIKSDYTTVIFIVLMVAAHLVLMGGHNMGGKDDDEAKGKKGVERQACH